jgi:hypothetical protein
VPNGVLVRAWRYLFARDSHAECRAALEQEHLARKWEREKLYELVQDLQKRLIEVADPGINHRLSPPKPKEKPAPVKATQGQMVDLLPGLN